MSSHLFSDILSKCYRDLGDTSVSRHPTAAFSLQVGMQRRLKNREARGKRLLILKKRIKRKMSSGILFNLIFSSPFYRETSPRYLHSEPSRSCQCTVLRRGDSIPRNTHKLGKATHSFFKNSYLHTNSCLKCTSKILAETLVLPFELHLKQVRIAGETRRRLG